MHSAQIGLFIAQNSIIRPPAIWYIYSVGQCPPVVIGFMPVLLVDHTIFG